MDYEKLYKEALERAREYKKYDYIMINAALDNIFPELKESEDEKIRKDVMSLVDEFWSKIGSIHPEFTTQDKMIAWLEKHGEKESEDAIIPDKNEVKDIEQSSIELDRDRVAKGIRQDVAFSIMNYLDRNTLGMCLSNMECEDIESAIISGDWDKIYRYMKKKLEKQGEKKSNWSEDDEKTRNGLIAMLNFAIEDGSAIAPGRNTTKEEALAWLEKQGEKEISVSKEFNYTYEAKVGNGNIKGLISGKVQLPKFKIGDWIVWQDKPYKVNYNSCGYELVDQNGLSTSLEYGTIDENAHLWTIQDAKYGDVLVSQYDRPFIYNGNHNSFNIGAYCGISVEGGFKVSTEKCHWTSNVNVHPATKDQRDILFSKMKECGYEWDAEKKEIN